MAKPTLKKSKTATSGIDKARTLLDSAQQIWMAGVGALGRAQEEGTRLFEALVREGLALEAKTRHFAAGKVDTARDAVETTVAQVKERASDTWDKLEKVFEQRVSRALGRLGVPGRDEMQALIDRVEELNRQVRKLNAGAARPKARVVARKRPARANKPATPAT